MNISGILSNINKKTTLKDNKIINYAFQVVGPLVLSGLILWWMYRGFDWDEFFEALTYHTDWTWMLLSMPFGVTAQVFRALRWKQALEPVQEHPRTTVCINSVYLSYAASLVIPRIGEVLRCGVLSRYDGTSFSKSLGTVVTERIVDSVFVVLLAGFTILFQIPVFVTFFRQTGVSVVGVLQGFSLTGYIVTIVCVLAFILLLAWLVKRLSVFKKTRNVFVDLRDGLISLRKIKSVPLFLFYTIGIWLSYYLHFYFTFFCFESTSSLGMSAALVAFVVGCFAVLVPTPNGAGPWHFAVKTVLLLYGVQAQDGVMFVLTVHTLQTLLVLVLGLYAIVRLQFIRRIPRQAVSHP